MSKILHLDWWLVLLDRRTLTLAAEMIRQRWEINEEGEAHPQHGSHLNEECAAGEPGAARPEAALLPDTCRRQLHALYEEEGWVWHIICLWVPPRDAEDAFHDVFVRAMTRISTFDRQKGSLRAWLIGIARKVAMEYRRRRGIRWLLIADDRPGAAAVDTEAPGGDGDGVAPGEGNAVAGGLHGLAEAEQISRVFDRLSNADVEILVLHDAFDFSVGELAIGLEKTEGAIRSRLVRARDRFEIELRRLEGRRDGRYEQT